MINSGLCNNLPLVALLVKKDKNVKFYLAPLPFGSVYSIL